MSGYITRIGQAITADFPSYQAPYHPTSMPFFSSPESASSSESEKTSAVELWVGTSTVISQFLRYGNRNNTCLLNSWLQNSYSFDPCLPNVVSNTDKCCGSTAYHRASLDLIFLWNTQPILRVCSELNYTANSWASWSPWTNYPTRLHLEPNFLLP